MALNAKIISNDKIDESSIFDGAMDNVMTSANDFLNEIKNEIRGHHAPLEIRSKDGVRALQYPRQENGVWNNTPMMLFTIYNDHGISNAGLFEQNRTALRGTFVEQTQAVIMLPMPLNGLSDHINNSIGDSNPDFLQYLLANGIDAFANGGDMTESSKAAFGSVTSTIKQEASKNLKQYTQQYNSSMGSNKVITANRGHHGFRGTEANTYTFNYRFYPKNRAELKEIGMIIQEFKLAAVPNQTGSGNAGNGYSILECPPLCSVKEIVIRGSSGKMTEKPARFTPRFLTGVAQIKGVKVSTGSDGNGYPVFDGTAGDPTVIDLEITVQDLLYKTREQIRASFDDEYAMQTIAPNRAEDVFKSTWAGRAK
ncbi:TPA: baseplate tail-tube junction protein [Aeromonas sobria]|nr:baseplate tail-tube junction protein [Aeromonas sobria]